MTRSIRLLIAAVASIALSGALGVALTTDEKPCAADAGPKPDAVSRAEDETEPPPRLPDVSILTQEPRATQNDQERPPAPLSVFFSRFYDEARLERADETIEFEEFPLVDDPSKDEGRRLCSRWARFPVGSWARLRTTSVSYENNRPVRSVTETRALLKSVDFKNKRYELLYDSTIKLGAVDYSRRSEVVLYDFWDVPVDETTKSEALEPVNLIIGAKAIPCLTRRVVRKTAKQRDVTTLWYSPVVAPYLLQRETTRETLAEKEGCETPASARELYVVQKTASRGTNGFAPQRYIARSSSVSGKRSQATTTILSTSIPGGVLRETTSESRIDAETEANDYQTTTVLLDYYIPR